MHFEKVDETVTCYIGPLPNLLPPPPPPPQGPIGVTLGTAMNNFYSSPKKVSTHNILYLDYSTSGSGEDVWYLHGFGPWEPPCTIWRTLNPRPLRMIPAKFGWNPTMRFQEVDETVTFYIGPPSPTCYPHRGPLGPPWELPWTIFILHLRRYLHTT